MGLVPAFLQAHEIDLIVRAHEPKDLGAELFADRVLTVFSAADYPGSQNAGALPGWPLHTCTPAAWAAVVAMSILTSNHW